MNFKKFLILFYILISGCVPIIENNVIYPNDNKNGFVNKGFTLIYNNEHFEKKKVSKKLDDRELLIFQRNLKKGTLVKIKNILNNKNIVVKVGEETDYSNFYNSLINFL